MFQIKKFDSYDELSIYAGNEIFRNFREHLRIFHKYVLGLATGSSPKQTYTHLIHKLSDESLDLSHVYTFNLDEYYPIKKNDHHSFYHEMTVEFWEPLHAANKTFDISHGYILNGEAENPEEECKNYEQLIEIHGGIDLQILGIGVNGHIAFNEPGSAGNSRTRKIIIAEETREANTKFFEGAEHTMPEHGLTMGIATILEAKKIFLLISGEGKRPIFEKLIHIKEPTSEIPASFLFHHPDVTIFTDLS